MARTRHAWKIDANTYRQHLAAPPNTEGVRHAVCGLRFRAIDIDIDDPDRADRIGYQRCRECDNAEQIEQTYGLVVSL